MSAPNESHPKRGVSERPLHLVQSGMITELVSPESWRHVLNDYMAWQHASHIPLSTIKLRSYHLRRLATLTSLAPALITLDVLLDHLGNPRWSAGTKRSVRTTLRSFFGWALRAGIVAVDPAAFLPTIRVPMGTPHPASDESVTQGKSSVDDRVRLMVELGAHVGLRCCEIAVVHSRDVLGSRGRHSLLVHGKGGKRRTVPISDDLARVLIDLDGYAFPGAIDGHLSAGYISKLVSKALGDSATAHWLRHRFATRALRASGGNLRVVQELLGHASVATTQIYTLVDDDELRQAALAA